MKILTDETVANSTILMLRDRGYDVIDVREVGLGGAKDTDVALLATSQDRLIVTHDKHFGDYLLLRSMKHRGAIVLRLKDNSPVCTNRALSSLLSLLEAEYPEDYLVDRLIILTDHGFRARKLT